MEDVNIPNPNPFITEWLVSSRCRAIVFESCELYAALYRDVVAKRTGLLASSARTSTGIEGDRWVGIMSVGGGPNGTAYYAASHEFGTAQGEADDPTSRTNARTARNVYHDATVGAQDLNKILNLMGAL